jgi:hypothetical protein
VGGSQRNDKRSLYEDRNFSDSTKSAFDISAQHHWLLNENPALSAYDGVLFLRNSQTLG